MDIDDAWKARNEPSENISWEKLREEFELRNIESSLKEKITSRLGQKAICRLEYTSFFVCLPSSALRPLYSDVLPLLFSICSFYESLYH